MSQLFSSLRNILEHPLWQDRLRRWSRASHMETDPLWWRALIPLIFLVLFLWNWRLAGALVAGSFTTNALFALQAPQRQAQLRDWGRQLVGPNMAFTLALMGGMTAMLGTYLALSVWRLSGDRWLAIAMVAQGIVTVSILLILLWQFWQQRQQELVGQFDQMLRDITSPDSLQRLVATRQLQSQLQARHLSATQMQLAVESLRLMLERETVPVVRQAILDTLNV